MMVRGATTAPNQDAQGNVLSRGPGKGVGSWRGRAGYRAFVPIVKNTRFNVRPDADSELLWTAWHIVNSTEAGKPCRPPLQCSICSMRPEKSTLMNLVSTSKSSAECDCSWRPLHATSEGRAKLVEIATASDNDLVDSEADWVRLHLRRSERWTVIGVRCLLCKRERHVTSGGVLKRGAFTQCICVRKLQRANAKKPRKSTSSRTSTSTSSTAAAASLPSDSEEEDAASR